MVTQSRIISEAATELARTVERTRNGGDVYGIFDGLTVGESVFVMGHRFHWLGVVHSVSEDGQAITLDCVHQIDYDEENTPGATLYPLGDGWRLNQAAIGGAVQKITGRPQGYQDEWMKALKAWRAKTEKTEKKVKKAKKEAE